MLKLVAVIAAALPISACASKAPRVRWEPTVVWQGDAAFETVKAGRPDPEDPNPQIVGADQKGRVVLVNFNGGRAPRARVIYDNRSEVTGLCLADIDPDVPGEEIYAGCYEPGEEGAGGNVVQIARTPSGWKARRIFDAGAYVHALAAVPPARAGAPARLVAATYANEIHLIAPVPSGPWRAEPLYRGPRALADAGPRDPRARLKDVALVADPSGRPPHEILAVGAGGDAIHVDLDRPGSGRVVHVEEGGLSRVCPDGTSGAYACGYAGRLLRFVRAGAGGWKVEVCAREGKESGLRGVATGRFPLPDGGDARLAIFGFHARCRLLPPGGEDPLTIFEDAGRGHALAAADLVPGNDADELILGGYSKRIVVLVARPAPR